MTEHENMWALGMYIGTASFGIFVALYLYTFRLLGIKVSVLARTKERIVSEIVLAIIFGVILVAGRQVRLLGFEFAPHIAALIAGGYLAYLLYKYPGFDNHHQVWGSACDRQTLHDHSIQRIRMLLKNPANPSQGTC